MQLNEADNALTDAARLSLFRGKLLERAEEIVRESVRLMEKIKTLPCRQGEPCRQRPSERHGRGHRLGASLTYPSWPQCDCICFRGGQCGGRGRTAGRGLCRDP